MATIESSIALYDSFSPVLNNIMDAMNLTIACVRDMQGTMEESIDTSTFQAAENAIHQAGAAMENLNRQIQSGSMANTERYLRDNTDEQGRFNQEIQNGATASDGLLSKIKQIAGAYLTIQGIGKVIELSDTVTQTEARLDLIVDDGGSVEELQQKIFNAAQDARADYMTTADAISKLGTQAGDAFTSNDELIAFTTLLNKEFVNAGTSAQGIDSVMLQLTQSMAAGKLQGEELNAVLDNAAPIVSKIKTYLEEVQGIDATNIKELASEGVLTADVVKNAMFYAAEEIDETFNNMPMTFEQVANSIKNNALVAFDPVLKKLNDIANSERFNSMVNGTIGALTMLANVAVEVFDILTTGAALIYDNWDVIGPVFYYVAGAIGFLSIMSAANAIAMKAQAVASGVATFAAKTHSAATAMQRGETFKATVAQYGLNAALLACPITWVVLGIFAIVAAIGVVTAVINKVCGTSISAAGMIVGCVYYIMGAITNCGLLLDNIFFGAIEAAKATGNNIKEAFKVAIYKVESIFYGLAAVALGVIADIAADLSKLPFVEFDASGLGAKASEYAGKAAEKANYQANYQDIGAAWDKGFNTYGYLDLDSEFERGYEWGAALKDKISDALSIATDDNTSGYDPNAYLNDLENIASDTSGSSADTAKNTADIAEALDITNDELKYLRDIKEQEIIDRTVYRDIIVDIGEMKNTVKNEADLDGIASRLANHITEQIKISAEGV